MEFYIESADRPYQSGVANSDVQAGQLVYDGTNGVEPFAYADAPDLDGVAVYEPEYLAAEDEDAISNEVYSASDGDRVPYGGNADGDVIKVRTIGSTGGPSAPSISHGDVLGVVDSGDANAPADADGRVVAEGYSNGGTTFNRSNNNFVAVGRAIRPNKQNDQGAVTAFDEPVRLDVYGTPQS